MGRAIPEPTVSACSAYYGKAITTLRINGVCFFNPWETIVTPNYKACPSESGTDKFMQRFI